MIDIHWIPVLVATVIGFVIGALWYSPFLFGNIWKKVLDKTPEDMAMGKADMNKMMLYSFGITFATALALHATLRFIGAEGIKESLVVSLFLAFGFMVTMRFSDLLYSYKPPHWGKNAQTRFLIDAGYPVVLLAVMGIVLSLF